MSDFETNKMDNVFFTYKVDDHEEHLSPQEVIESSKNGKGIATCQILLSEFINKKIQYSLFPSR